MSAPFDSAPLVLRPPVEDAGAEGVQSRQPVASGLDRLVSLAEVALCSGLPTQVLVTLVLLVAGMQPTTARGDLSLAYVTTLSLADTILLVGLVMLLLRRRGESPARVMLGRRRWPREAALGLALVPVVFGAVAGLVWLVQHQAPWLHNVPDNPLASLLRSPLDYVVVGAVAVVAGGLREEIQRAFVLHRFEQHLGGGLVGLIVFSAWFGLGHFVQGYDVILITGLLGVAWGALYFWRRSVVAAVVCHSLFNLLEVAAYGVVP